MRLGGKWSISSAKTLSLQLIDFEMSLTSINCKLKVFALAWNSQILNRVILGEFLKCLYPTVTKATQVQGLKKGASCVQKAN